MSPQGHRPGPDSRTLPGPAVSRRLQCPGSSHGRPSPPPLPTPASRALSPNLPISGDDGSPGRFGKTGRIGKTGKIGRLGNYGSNGNPIPSNPLPIFPLFPKLPKLPKLPILPSLSIAKCYIQRPGLRHTAANRGVDEVAALRRLEVI